VVGRREHQILDTIRATHPGRVRSVAARQTRQCKCGWMNAHIAPEGSTPNGNLAGQKAWIATFTCGRRSVVARIVLDERVGNPQPGYALAAWLAGEDRTGYDRDEKPRVGPTTQVRSLLGPERFRVLVTAVDLDPSHALGQQLQFEAGEGEPPLAPMAAARQPDEIKTIEVIEPGWHDLVSLEAQLRAAADRVLAVEPEGWQIVGVPTGIKLTVGRPPSAPARKG
jgi:hypothetical protein